jgi:hypothetical protein
VGGVNGALGVNPGPRYESRSAYYHRRYHRHYYHHRRYHHY